LDLRVRRFVLRERSVNIAVEEKETCRACNGKSKIEIYNPETKKTERYDCGCDNGKITVAYASTSKREGDDEVYRCANCGHETARTEDYYKEK
jgi:predicted SprT family Zn-dependent metalloprotease